MMEIQKVWVGIIWKPRANDDTMGGVAGKGPSPLGAYGNDHDQRRYQELQFI